MFTTGTESGNGKIVLTYTKPATATTLRSSDRTSPAGATVIYTATVSPVPRGGTVTFSDNGTVIASYAARPVDTSTGAATCALAYRTIGTRPITAGYSGDATYAPSVLAILTQSIVRAGSTATSLKSSANPSIVTHQVTYTATVSPAPDGGTVAFSDDGIGIAPCADAAGGHLDRRGHVLGDLSPDRSAPDQGRYSGDPSYPPSSTR